MKTLLVEPDTVASKDYCNAVQKTFEARNPGITVETQYF